MMAQSGSRQVATDIENEIGDSNDSDIEETRNLIDRSDQYSSNETLHHQSSPIKRSNYGSVQGLVNNPILYDEAIDNRGKRNDKKILIKCTITFVIVIGIFLISGSVGAVLFCSSYNPTNQFTKSLKIGDNAFSNGISTAYLFPLVNLKSSISSIKITLIHPRYVKAVVYETATLPIERMEHLPRTRIPELSGPSRYNYNYYGADEPIYLLTKSVLIYKLLIFVDIPSDCPARLFLFSNETNYMNFKNYEPYKATYTSCSPVHPPNTTFSTTFTLNITEPSLYYVGIEIDDGVSVTSNVSVISIQYNTTGLESPSECSQPLSANNPSCKWTLCSSDFICNRPIATTYIFIKPTGSVKITYTTSNANIHGKDNIISFGFSLFLFIISLIALVSFFLFLIYYRVLIIKYIQHIPSARSEINSE